MKIKISKATPIQMDWLVAKCEELDIIVLPERRASYTHIEFRSKDTGWDFRDYSPSTDWSQGGPIIEREKIGHGWTSHTKDFIASLYGMDIVMHGPTPLIAAMRCYVASKLGANVDIPEELV